MHWCVFIETTGEAWPLPRGLAGSLGSVRHASLVSILHAFPIVLPFFIVYRHSHCSFQMPCGMSAGQPSFWRGSTSILPHALSTNIAQRLRHRALTGRGLGVLVHHYSGFRIHLQLNGAFGGRSFERRLPDHPTMERFCSTHVWCWRGGIMRVGTAPTCPGQDSVPGR